MNCNEIKIPKILTSSKCASCNIEYKKTGIIESDECSFCNRAHNRYDTNIKECKEKKNCINGEKKKCKKKCKEKCKKKCVQEECKGKKNRKKCKKECKEKCKKKCVQEECKGKKNKRKFKNICENNIMIGKIDSENNIVIGGKTDKPEKDLVESFKGKEINYNHDTFEYIFIIVQICLILWGCWLITDYTFFPI